MSTISETFAAGVPKEFIKPGKFFKLFRTSYAVDVHFFRNGQELPEDALQVEAGFGITVVGGFDRFTIVTAAAQTVWGGNPGVVPVLASRGAARLGSAARAREEAGALFFTTW